MESLCREALLISGAQSAKHRLLSPPSARLSFLFLLLHFFWPQSFFLRPCFQSFYHSLSPFPLLTHTKSKLHQCGSMQAPSVHVSAHLSPQAFSSRPSSFGPLCSFARQCVRLHRRTARCLLSNESYNKRNQEGPILKTWHCWYSPFHVLQNHSYVARSRLSPKYSGAI